MGVSVNSISDYYSKLNINQQKYFTGKNAETHDKIDVEANGKFDPESAGAMVRAHEQEHVNHEAAKAQMSGRTVTKADNDDSNSDRKDFFLANYNDLIAQNFGLVFDVRV